MKKMCIGALVTAIIVLYQSFGIYGAYSSVGSEVKIISGAMVISDQMEIGGSVVTGKEVGAKSDGTKVDVNNLEVKMIQGPASRIGLPPDTSKSITAINSGTHLNEVIKDVDLTGYKALVQTSSIVMRDKTTQAEAKAEIVINFYVPNLSKSLKNVQVLFYDKALGKWIILTPIDIDYKNKKLSVKITGSGTFTVIYSGK